RSIRAHSKTPKEPDRGSPEPQQPRLQRRVTPDTLSKVIHRRGKSSGQSAHRPKVVNNFAASYNRGGEQLAPLEQRLVTPYPTRVTRRSPTPAAAPGPSAERTAPHEGSSIRSRPSRVPARLRATQNMNTHWTEQPYFAALDWAK